MWVGFFFTAKEKKVRVLESSIKSFFLFYMKEKFNIIAV